VLGLAVGDTSGIHPPAPLCRPQGDGCAPPSTPPARTASRRPSLEPLIQFGWLTIIAKPLYLACASCTICSARRYNWGWAIIIFTVIFNLLMLPTRFMMMKSSLKMMRIQPKVEAIKKRYAHLKMTDPKRAEMNTEMMELYKPRA
jgi:YidC/Oxa1 family membrane protein insertase